MAHLFKSRRRCVPSLGSLALASVRHAPAIYRKNVALTGSSARIAVTCVLAAYLIPRFLVEINTWPAFLCWFGGCLLFVKLLVLSLGVLESAPERMSIDPFPNQSGLLKKAMFVGWGIVIIMILCSPFMKALPSWASIAIAAAVCPLLLILVTLAIKDYVGANGVLWKS
jgi:hypothetical protein